MAVGHPDYWSRMISRISVEGYVPEYYYFLEGALIDSMDSSILLSYAIPAGWVYNVIGFGASCKDPGINQVSVIILGGNGMSAWYDTNYRNEMPIGMFETMVYGDTLRLTLSNTMSHSSIFFGWVQCLKEFIG